MIDQINVTVTQAPPINVTVTQQQGPAGRPGAQGEQGIQGAPGAMATSFVFTQALALATWSITHNLGRFPSVTVVDSSERVVEGDVQYLNGNSLTVSFSAPFSGVAYLN